MKYYIEVGTINKAKQDIDEVCRREGYANLTRHNFGKGGVGRFLTKLVSVSGILFRLKRGDVLAFDPSALTSVTDAAFDMSDLRNIHVVGMLYQAVLSYYHRDNQSKTVVLGFCFVLKTYTI